MGIENHTPMKAVLNQMQWLVMLHVLSAVIGIGPTFAFPLLLRNTSSAAEMTTALGHVAKLELFPKLFGTLAVLSGFALFWLGSYGSFMQIWIIGTLLLYIVIEVLIIGFLNPTAKKLHEAVGSPDVQSGGGISPQAGAMYARVRSYHLWATVLSTVIIVLMILKPH
ncbi:DUF2269 family protein [Paenibacillus mesophilus]|uniref:DUF2269 family protein n=1 Tax=Paenibacillus mesophilus TaxID=2582849 RepID=UPI00110DF2F7|nr:DUF2269 family protein [Paenibacillus mesophilus]TMV48976.1 DUF2269 family protein [Paenibacillus mesophilus]